MELLQNVNYLSMMSRQSKNELIDALFYLNNMGENITLFINVSVKIVTVKS